MLVSWTLKTVPVDMQQLSNVVSKEVVKNKKFKNNKYESLWFRKRIPDANPSILINQYNTDKQNLENKTGGVDKKYGTLVV